MSTSNISSLTFISQQVYIYMGIPMLIAGLVGCLLNTIVFLSLQTFRQNSCALYLMFMSAANIGQLITGLLFRIMISGFGIDWTLSSTFYCKFRFYCVTVCTVISFTCMCLATIDQFLATYHKPRWQQWSNIKVAHRIIIVFIIFWLLHGILYLIYVDHIPSPITGKLTCMSHNPIFQQYYVNFYTAGLIGFIPISINTLFGILAYHNITHLAHRTVPLVRRELDKQLTSIVLMQTLFVFVTAVPYIIVTILNSNLNIVQQGNNAEKLQFASTLTICIYYLNFAVSDEQNDEIFTSLYDYRVPFM
jgi:hypothetical protein